MNMQNIQILFLLVDNFLRFGSLRALLPLWR
jgi:hypothetical protein